MMFLKLTAVKILIYAVETRFSKLDFLFIDNSNITKDFLHNDELHLNKVGSFLLGQNFVKYFNECL